MDKRIKEMMTNDLIQGLYMLKELTTGTTTAGKPYIRGILADSTGTIPFVMWDADEQAKKLEAGVIVKIAGVVNTYKDVKQIKCDWVLQADMNTIDNPALYMPCAEESAEDMWQYLFNKTNDIKCLELRLTTQDILKENKSVLLTMPGGKMVHHDVVSGLLVHTKGVLNNAIAIASNYHQIDKNLVISGAILHDIGKLWEYEQSGLGLVSDYSILGNLAGHLYIGAKYVSEQCAIHNVPAEKKMLLEHIILSHHGEREKGTIVEPKTKEAYIVHMADELDAKLNVFDKALKEINEGQVSDKQFALNNVRIYKPKNESEENKVD